MTAALKLRAQDADDLIAMAACLQDALVQLRDMTYVADEKRFVLVLNRFRWECPSADTEAGPYQRVQCGLTVERVAGVRLYGIDQRNRLGFLSVLTIEVEDRALKLLFAGGGEIRLDVEELFCHLQDIGEPWPTPWRPHHSVED